MALSQHPLEFRFADTRRSTIAVMLASVLGMTAVSAKPPSDSNPAIPIDEPDVVAGCGEWKTDPNLAVCALELTEGDWLDSERIRSDWRYVASQSPCSSAAGVRGRLRYFREGALQPSSSPHPEVVSAWRKRAWHARALVQAGDGENRDEVAMGNDFYVDEDTGFGGARRNWQRFSNYQPPLAGTEPTLGQVIRFKVEASTKVRIVLDRRTPDCGVESGCAAAEVQAQVELEIDGRWLVGAEGEEIKRVFDDIRRRQASSRVTTQRFCTEGSMTESDSIGGSISLGFPQLVNGEWSFERSRNWTVPLSNLYDSGFEQAPLDLSVEFCKVTSSTEPIHSWIKLNSSGRVHASLNAGTWAEGLAEVSCNELDIVVQAGCIDCTEEWHEPSPTHTLY
jgi:hypothetical protein